LVNKYVAGTSFLLLLFLLLLLLLLLSLYQLPMFVFVKHAHTFDNIRIYWILLQSQISKKLKKKKLWMGEICHARITFLIDTLHPSVYINLNTWGLFLHLFTSRKLSHIYVEISHQENKKILKKKKKAYQRQIRLHQPKGWLFLDVI